MRAARVGILGGGQLALMTAEAAPALGVEIVVLEREAGSPAGLVVGGDNEIVGHWSDERCLAALAQRVDLVTLENEFVDAAALAWLVERGCPVYPSPACVGLIQDKLAQKQALAEAGLPVAPYRAVDDGEDVAAAASDWGWPLVLKARRNAYDGYGNATLAAAGQADPAIGRLARGTGAGGPGGLYVEAWQPFEAELAVIIARGPDGSVAAYPAATTVQRNHICHEVLIPARLTAEVSAQAQRTAVRAVEVVDAVGVVGVELFLLPGGRIVINELAPRPHNSGHYSIEGCRTSQFANHLLGVLGQPLGATGLLAGGAAMVNLLGTTAGPATPRGVEVAAAQPFSYVHVYGKREVRVGRKMGHVTALGDTTEQAVERARRAAGMIDW